MAAGLTQIVRDSFNGREPSDNGTEKYQVPDKHIIIWLGIAVISQPRHFLQHCGVEWLYTLT